MPKCIFNKKHTKHFNKCEITGQLMQSECYFYGKYPCKHFRMSLLDRFFMWLEDKFG